MAFEWGVEWKNKRFDNLKALLDAHGKGEKFEAIAKPLVITKVTKEGFSIVIERTNPKGTVRNVLALNGESEIDVPFMDGQKAKVITSVNPGQELTIKAVDHDYVAVMSVENGKLKEVFSSKGVTATRWSVRA